MRLLLVTLLCVWSSVAVADDGGSCDFRTGTEVGSTFYATIGDIPDCILLADGRTAASDTNTIPFHIPGSSQARTVTYSVGQCPAGCVFGGNIDIMESDSPVVGAPNVWSRLARLDGCTSADVASVDPGRPPRAYVYVLFPNIVDAACNGTLGVDGIDIIATVFAK